MNKGVYFSASFVDYLAAPVHEMRKVRVARAGIRDKMKGLKFGTGPEEEWEGRKGRNRMSKISTHMDAKEGRAIERVILSFRSACKKKARLSCNVVRNSFKYF